jgi:hypothetical protein
VHHLSPEEGLTISTNSAWAIRPEIPGIHEKVRSMLLTFSCMRLPRDSRRSVGDTAPPKATHANLRTSQPLPLPYSYAT